MPTYPIAHRVANYLHRQIVWAEAAIRELDAFCALPDTANFDEEEARQVRRAKETRDMAKEYNGLLNEWEKAADVDPSDRAEIQALSAQAQALLDELRQAYARADTAATRMKARNVQSTQDLRRGRRSVNIYRPGVLVQPGFIDKQA